METGHIDKGDVHIEKLGPAEVKGGTQVPVFLYKARKREEHCLIVKRDRQKWLICMPKINYNQVVFIPMRAFWEINFREPL